jgi:hypothetical protein
MIEHRKTGALFPEASVLAISSSWASHRRTADIPAASVIWGRKGINSDQQLKEILIDLAEHLASFHHHAWIIGETCFFSSDKR